MTERKVKFPLAVILYCVLLVLSVANVLQMVSWGMPMAFLLSVLVSAGVQLLIVVSLFMRKRTLLLAAFGLQVLLSLYGMLSQFRVPTLCYLVAFLSLAALGAVSLRAEEDDLVVMARRLWFLPGIIYAVGCIAQMFANGAYAGFLIRMPLEIAAVVLAGHWLAFPYESAHADTPDSTGEFHCDMAMHVVLLFVTCGIWALVWVHRTTRFGNRAKGFEAYNPTSKLLLYMFIPFYSIYWFAKQGQRLDAIAHEAGDREESATVYLLLGIFIPVVAIILMQDRINKIERGAFANRPAPQYTQPPQYAPQPAPVPNAEASLSAKISEIKALLDAGLITEDEFNEKKRQLLGL